VALSRFIHDANLHRKREMSIEFGISL